GATTHELASGGFCGGAGTTTSEQNFRGSSCMAASPAIVIPVVLAFNFRPDDFGNGTRLAGIFKEQEPLHKIWCLLSFSSTTAFCSPITTLSTPLSL
ncbi:hypothetical protein A2U01_0072024, partial [Trifolium medium]|nr:hypothetical protein [Trifolium medium]